MKKEVVYINQYLLYGDTEWKSSHGERKLYLWRGGAVQARRTEIAVIKKRWGDTANRKGRTIKILLPTD